MPGRFIDLVKVERHDVADGPDVIAIAATRSDLPPNAQFSAPLMAPLFSVCSLRSFFFSKPASISSWSDYIAKPGKILLRRVSGLQKFCRAEIKGGAAEVVIGSS